MLLPDFDHLWLFIVAGVGLAVLPGPAVFYIVARSINQGRLAGLISVLGVGSGGLVHVAAASLGVSAIVLASATAFTLLKWLGAAYLIYLGIQALVSEQPEAKVTTTISKRLATIYMEGALVNIFNPKTALFFLAFLPQFVTPGLGAISAQMASLGVLFVFIALFSDMLYVLAADFVFKRLKGDCSPRKWPRYTAAGIYIALGISTLFVGDTDEVQA